MSDNFVNNDLSEVLKLWLSNNGWVKFISLFSFSGEKIASFPAKKRYIDGELLLFVLDIVNSIQNNQFFIQNGGLQEIHLDVKRTRMYVRIIEDKAILVVSMAKEVKLGLMNHDLRPIVKQLTHYFN